MMILLPPSETKRPGGKSSPAEPAGWALPGLLPQREQVRDALVALAADAEATRRVLKLSDKQLAEALLDNAGLRTAAVMPAVDRYTGVLYDALDAATLDGYARRWLGAHVLVHSAPFGPVGALDPIPSYRLGAGASVPGLPPLRRLWADAVAVQLAVAAPSFVLDLRSEAYADLGPVPAELPSAYVRVVTEQGKALNHFNKHAKGDLVRRLATERPKIGSRRTLLNWAGRAGVRLQETGEHGILELVTDQPTARK
ncbi:MULTISPECIES: YaaA family protein [unclassified Microbacterium]|uniref:YaaA family protein n=1 Tax=unclassified Microbacterium TaxID=2609290 RepID=UPI001E496BE1|nr:peroxide stress protein YaaA [Microbacterium sp. Au-Mic1]MCE4025846.1 peroxide stress protein YaaA [Microbacterium sp. Au-Mic1]